MEEKQEQGTKLTLHDISQALARASDEELIEFAFIKEHRVDGPYRSADAVASYVAQRLRLVLRNFSPVRPLRRKVESLQRAFMDVGPDDHLLGIPLHSVEVRIVSEDSVIGEDGRQYVVVNSVATGTVLVAVDDLRFYDKEEDR